jgi:hypothetical protein
MQLKREIGAKFAEAQLFPSFLVKLLALCGALAPSCLGFWQKTGF